MDSLYYLMYNITSQKAWPYWRYDVATLTLNIIETRMNDEVVIDTDMYTYMCAINSQNVWFYV